MVELLAAVLCVAIAENWVVQAEPGTLLLHATIETLLYFVFAGGLLIATFVDLEWMEIPDEVSLPCAALGLLSAPFRMEPGVWSAAVGAGAGEGDSKLLLMIGAFLGWKGAIFSVVAGSVQGLVFAAFALVTGRKLTPDIEERVIDGEVIEAPEEPEASRVGVLRLPFGPFLALGALEYLLAGDTILSWYFGLLQR
jgi:leader peptidase (prepilin peptidase)/N-methyltransferase